MWFGSGSSSHKVTNSAQVSSKISPASTELSSAATMASTTATGGFSEPSDGQLPTIGAELLGGSSSGTSNTSITMQHSNNVQTTTISDRPEKISFHLKTSIFTRRVTVDSDKMALGLIKQLAVSFLNELYFQHQFPSNTYIGNYIKKNFSNNDNINDLFDRLLLRKYIAEQELFVPFNLVSDIEPESVISIEVADRAHPHQQTHSNEQHHLLGNQASALQASCQQIPLKMSHEFKLESFMFPAYCSSCSALIKGFIRQGYQCSYCEKKYCPKCKSKAETAEEACLTPIAVTPSQNSNQSKDLSQLATLNSENGSNIEPNGPANQKSNSTSSNSSSSNNNGSRLEVLGVSMTKRKSTSNLLLFNLANPFKSHHNSSSQQGQQQSTTVKEAENKPTKARGSTGTLDTVSRSLGNKRQHDESSSQQQQPESARELDNLITMTDCSDANLQDTSNTLMVSQNNHISSSHQNLFMDLNGQMARDAAVLSIADDHRLTLATGCDTMGSSGSSSVYQSSGSSGGKNHASQLSNSANTSTQDLNVAPSMKRDQANHTFISMDWIQINGEPLCGVCNKVLRTSNSGYQQQQAVFAPFMCKICKLQVHAQCQNLVLTDCMSRIAESSRAAAAKASDEADSGGLVDTKSRVMNTSSNASRDNIRLHRLAPSVKHIKRPDSTVPIIEGWLKHTTLSDEQARQHYWRLDDTDITLYENDCSTRYFKAIALSKIKRVMPANELPKRVREDVLMLDSPNKTSAHLAKTSPKSANTSPSKSPELLAQMNAMFAFELATGSMYLVQASSEDQANMWKESLAAMTARFASPKQQSTGSPVADTSMAAATRKKEEPSGVLNTLVESVNKIELIKTIPAIIKEAATKTGPRPNPTSDQDTSETLVDVKATESPSARAKHQTPNIRHQNHHHQHFAPASAYLSHNRGAHKTYTDPNRSRLYNRPRIVIKLDPMSVPDHLIAGKYLIERDRVKGVGFEELGSGQFGKVYAAISEYKKDDGDQGLWSGVPVAIKEISKARFDLRQQAKLKNEANILSHLDHPGVIILERVHDLPDKIYIVMEQLEDDMLEMIVSTPEKRLNERITKFLTYQILEALKYLHGKNIAHCDLKPENVLLVERRSQFPQIKLCDFGFAKIIEENSFRSSLVGTPAYLAPEVVKGERYNRSVDLWSVGVIVYVSLSGEFPFNEGENIHDQISRANFMYPDQPWARISNQAKSFINSLLRVNCERRLSAYKAQMDEWLQVRCLPLFFCDNLQTF